jgi:hypothetical protein
MRRSLDLLDTFGFLLLGLAAGAGMAGRAWWDFTHPREWESFAFDPHVYSWAVAAEFVTFVFVFTRGVRQKRRTRRRARLARLTRRTRELIRDNRLSEAEECLRQCQALAGYRPDQPKTGPQRV